MKILFKQIILLHTNQNYFYFSLHVTYMFILLRTSTMSDNKDL